ncbi:probable serine carboxypeptidase CPVL [Antedon mediterranea]|uniref:probable serine carboxypeptidase CPVL n=1 Tax=Antedon mediterranea TaxID=105859 RepID=UPI003AF720FC
MAFFKFMLSLLVLLCNINCLHSLRILYPNHPQHTLKAKQSIDPGKPLILTPYIESGNIDEGRKLSLVSTLNSTIKSYAGYFTVDKTFNSNTFFWFFPAEVNSETAPVLLWLQGGPGGSSMFGLFSENGPFYVTDDMKLKPREWSWTKKYSMIYIDNPVATGFSFTNGGFAQNETAVGWNLHSALTQFFQLFPMYQNNELYLTGESYAGKYIPALGFRIHQENPKAFTKINLKGMAIGDGLCDPESMFPAYGDFLYQIGVMDNNEKNYVDTQIDTVVQLIQEKQFLKANQVLSPIIEGGDSGRPSFFTNVTGLSSYYNYLDDTPPPFGDYAAFLNQDEVRKAIHVGTVPFNNGDDAANNLEVDITQTIKPWLETLADNYKVLIYNGQLDIIVATPLTERFLLKAFTWKGSEAFQKVKKVIWKVNKDDKDVAGYVRQVDDFIQVVVRGGGHILPADQPERTFNMIDRFVSGTPFDA